MGDVVFNMNNQFEQLKKELEDILSTYESSVDSLKKQIRDVKNRLVDVNNAIEIKERLGEKASMLPPKIKMEWNDETNNFCIYFHKNQILSMSSSSLCLEHQKLMLIDYAWNLYDAYKQLFLDASNKKDIDKAELKPDRNRLAPGFELSWRHRHDPFESHYELKFKNDPNRTWRPDLDSIEDQEEALIKKSWIIYDVIRNFHF